MRDVFPERHGPPLHDRVAHDNRVQYRDQSYRSLKVPHRLGRRHRHWATSGHLYRSVGHLKSARWPTDFPWKINKMTWLWATMGHLGHLFGTM
ncbi:hypothetical protein MTBSS4_210039 [Magnetospirillum sp. SS-4]|nr:hypothetical protein MTBSS4_210039 [Magnetospirillum sp. SS-4]